jgi:phospholipid/cholesterol/gamma-HCH transport system ATP-binding protein
MNEVDPPVLEFKNVTLEAAEHSESALLGVDFQLGAGELLLVLLDREHLHVSLGDAACGLLTPSSGRVRFVGVDWAGLRADEAAARRGRIRWLFDEECWVANLDMDENLTLAERHHTRRDLEELREEATELARRFGLPGLPLGNPDRFPRQDLRKAACVRAFMGRAALIFLERPTNDIYAEVMSPLANAVYEARRRGAAVVWTTDHLRVWDDPGLKPTRRGFISGARMHFCDSHGKTISVPACQ